MSLLVHAACILTAFFIQVMTEQFLSVPTLILGVSTCTQLTRVYGLSPHTHTQLAPFTLVDCQVMLT